MPNGVLFVLFIIVALLAGAVVGYILKQIFTEKKIKASEVWRRGSWRNPRKKPRR